jgi:signal transduction histidine kinase/ActR/RegA family two-component response regulator
MSEPPSSSTGDDGGRLHRCIRDLATLQALPSMCIGRSPDETLEIVLDAVPTALGCRLLHLTLPGPPAKERASLRGTPLDEQGMAALRLAIDARADAEGAIVIPGANKLWCIDVDLPVGVRRGRLLAGYDRPLDPETDRVLIRSAANLVGTTLESADVLDSARRKDEFLAMLGHELRNPLAPILTAVELLARQPAVARERDVIDRHTRHLARLVDDLLDISRVTRGYVELRNEQVSLASVLERAVELAAALISRHRHVLHVASAEEVTLQGDPVRLAQVFGNLLTNAAKFTPAGGKIQLAIERAPDRVRVTVRDNGRGIEQRELARIFEPFVQVDRERDGLRGGLGLGLAIVHNLVERHHGSIVVHSDGPGRGSAFTVELPTFARIDKPVEVTQRLAPTTRARVRVLVVDDNEDLADLLSMSLRIEGFQTETAHDAHAALERWESFGPHAAVFDVGMPELDGYELARRVRAQHGSDPTLIAATGYGAPKDRTQAAEAGFDCHFVKPVSVHDLVRVLDERVVSAARVAP